MSTRGVTTVEELEAAATGSIFLAGTHVYRKERGALLDLEIGLMGYAEVLDEEGRLLCIHEPEAQK
jgi:hypothetical protein